MSEYAFLLMAAVAATRTTRGGRGKWEPQNLEIDILKFVNKALQEIVRIQRESLGKRLCDLMKKAQNADTQGLMQWKNAR